MSEHRASSTGSGGVRNLRAMFEGGSNESPSPSRGRSPGATSEGPGREDSGSRPLSKVRRSFVTVERSGEMGPQLGLQRSNESTSVAEKRRSSFSLNESQDPGALAELKQTISGERAARRKSAIIAETVPEVAIETPSIEVKEKDLFKSYISATSPAQKPGANPDKTVSAIEEEGGSLQPADPTSLAVTEGVDTSKKPEPSKTEKIVGQNGSTRKVTPRSQAPASPLKSSMQAKQPGSRPVPAPIKVSSARESSLKPTARSSGDQRSPRLPTSATQAPRQPTARHSSAFSPTKSSRASVAPKTTTDRSSAAATARTRHSTIGTGAGTGLTSNRHRESTATVSDTGFVKPKPRSPTRPVRLPSHATAPTASSSAKTSDTSAENKPGASNESGKASTSTTAFGQHTKDKDAANVKTSTARAVGGTTSSSLHKKPLQASIPVGQKKGERPGSRTSNVSGAGSTRAPDGGFLARMMRPTASSASKTHEKSSAEASHEAAHPAKATKAKSRTSGSSRRESVASSEARTSEPPSSATFRPADHSDALARTPLHEVPQEGPESLPAAHPEEPNAQNSSSLQQVASSKSETQRASDPVKVAATTPVSVEPQLSKPSSPTYATQDLALESETIESEETTKEIPKPFDVSNQDNSKSVSLPEQDETKIDLASPTITKTAPEPPDVELKPTTESASSIEETSTTSPDSKQRHLEEPTLVNDKGDNSEADVD